TLFAPRVTLFASHVTLHVTPYVTPPPHAGHIPIASGGHHGTPIHHRIRGAEPGRAAGRPAYARHMGGRFDRRAGDRDRLLAGRGRRLPAAGLAAVRLLDDGQLGLVIALPPGRQRQAWRLDPRTGGLESVLAEAAGPRLAFAPDDRHLAYVGADVGPSRDAT